MVTVGVPAVALAVMIAVPLVTPVSAKLPVVDPATPMVNLGLDHVRLALSASNPPVETTGTLVEVSAVSVRFAAVKPRVVDTPPVFSVRAVVAPLFPTATTTESVVPTPEVDLSVREEVTAVPPTIIGDRKSVVPTPLVIVRVSVANVKSASSTKRPAVDANGTRVMVSPESVRLPTVYPKVEVHPPVLQLRKSVAPLLPPSRTIESVVPTPDVDRKVRVCVANAPPTWRGVVTEVVIVVGLASVIADPVSVIVESVTLEPALLNFATRLAVPLMTTAVGATTLSCVQMTVPVVQFVAVALRSSNLYDALVR